MFSCFAQKEENIQDLGYPTTFNEELTGTKTYAYVIGVSDYSNSNMQDNQLSYADNDARLFASYLQNWNNIEINLFTNSNASSKKIIGEGIGKTLKSAQPGSRVVIYFAGHGDISPLTDEGYLLLNECDPVEDLEYSTSVLSVRTILAQAKLANKKNVEVYIILDACKSGHANFESIKQGINRNDSGEPISKTVFMLSSKSNQQSKEHRHYKHGLFTHFLVEGLGGQADENQDLMIDMEEISEYVKDSVKSAYKHLFPFVEKSQNPVFSSDIDDDYPLTEVFDFDPKLIADENDNSEIASRGNARGGISRFKSENSYTNALYRQYSKQIDRGSFFQNSINTVKNLDIGTDKIYFNEGKIISSFKLSDDKKSFATIVNGNVLISDSYLSNSNIIRLDHEQSIMDFTFCKTRDLIATVDKSNLISIWNSRSGSNLQSIRIENNEVTVLEFISDSLLAIGTDKGKLILLDLKGNKILNKGVKILKNRISQMECVNSTLVLSDNEGYLSFYDIEANIGIKRIKADDDKLNGFCVINSLNSVISIGSGGRVRRWSLDDFKMQAEYIIPAKLIEISIDPLEEYCFIGTGEGKIEILNVQTFEKIKSSIKDKSGIQEFEYDDLKGRFLVLNEQGQLYSMELVIESILSVYNLRQLILGNNISNSLKEIVNDDLLYGLNDHVNSVLSVLINQKEIQPMTKEIKTALKYTKASLKIPNQSTYNQNRLRINLLLLEVFEIISENNSAELQGALNRLKEVQELDPNGAYGFDLSAQIHTKLKNYSTAKAMSLEAEKRAPKWVVPKTTSGWIYMLNGENERAEEKFREVIELDSDYAKGFANLAKLYVNMDRISDAKLYAELASVIDSNIMFRSGGYFEIERIKQYTQHGGGHLLLLHDPNEPSSELLLDKIVQLQEQFNQFVTPILLIKNIGGSNVNLENTCGPCNSIHNVEYVTDAEEWSDIIQGNKAPGIIYIEGGFPYFEFYGNGSNEEDLQVIKNLMDRFDDVLESAMDIGSGKEPRKKSINNRSSLNIGDSYEGGIIVYIDGSGEHGIIAQNTNGSKYEDKWEGARQYCQTLELNTKTDWRLPTLEQMYLINKEYVNSELLRKSIPNGFYWTRSEKKQNWAVTTNMYWIDLYSKMVSWSIKKNLKMVLPIRLF